MIPTPIKFGFLCNPISAWTAWGNFWKNTTYKQCSSPPQKIQQMLQSAKYRRDPLTNAGVYWIPCSCVQVYIGTTKWSIHTRIKEHERHWKLNQPEKSAVAEHALKQAGHEILFQNIEILDNTSNHYVRLLHREAIEIHKHQQNFNKKEESLKLNKTWLPALKNTVCKRSTNSTQPQGQGVTTHKRPANDTHQSQWQIISPPYRNNTPTTKTHWSPWSPISWKGLKLISQP